MLGGIQQQPLALAVGAFGIFGVYFVFSLASQSLKILGKPVFKAFYRECVFMVTVNKDHLGGVQLFLL